MQRLTFLLGRRPGRRAESCLPPCAGENLEVASCEWPIAVPWQHVALASAGGTLDGLTDTRVRRWQARSQTVESPAAAHQAARAGHPGSLSAGLAAMGCDRHSSGRLRRPPLLWHVPVVCGPCEHGRGSAASGPCAVWDGDVSHGQCCLGRRLCSAGSRSGSAELGPTGRCCAGVLGPGGTTLVEAGALSRPASSGCLGVVGLHSRAGSYGRDGCRSRTEVGKLSAAGAGGVAVRGVRFAPGAQAVPRGHFVLMVIPSG